MWHYVEVLRIADRGPLTDGLATYDLEVANISAGRAWANAHAEWDQDAAMQFILYSLNGAQLYQFRLNTPERVVLYERCLEVNLHLKSPMAEAKTKLILGEAYTTFDLKRSIKFYREAADLYQTLGDVQQKAVAMGQIAKIFQQQGESDKALSIYYNECIPVFERFGDVRAKAVTMERVANILRHRGQTDEALRICIEEIFPVYVRLGEERSKAVTMGTIVDIFFQRGHTDEALHILKAIKIIFQDHGDVQSEAATMAQIADILQLRGQTHEALRIYRDEVLPVYERFGDMRAKAVSLGTIAGILKQCGQIDEALRIYRAEVLPVYEHLSDVHEMTVCRTNIGITLMNKSARTKAESDEAREHLIWARDTAEKHQYAEAAQLRKIVTRLFGGSV